MGGVVNAVEDVVGSVGHEVSKLIPNEIKPALPFAAAALPFLAPELVMGIGSLNGLVTNEALQGAIGSGLLNVGEQSVQPGFEKHGLNLGSVALASGIGGLSAPGGGENIKNLFGEATAGNVGGEAKTFADLGLNPANVSSGAAQSLSLTPESSLYQQLEGVPLTAPTITQQATNLLSSGLQKASDFMSVPSGGILDLSMKEGLQKAAIPVAQGAGDAAYNYAQQLMDKENINSSTMKDMSGQARQNSINDIIYAMRKAKFPDSQIQAALQRSGFGSVPIPTETPAPVYAKGGRAGYAMGGFPPFGGSRIGMETGGGLTSTDLANYLGVYGSKEAKDQGALLSYYNKYKPEGDSNITQPTKPIKPGEKKRFNAREYISDDPAKYAQGLPYTGMHPDLFGMKQYYARNNPLDLKTSGPYTGFNPTSQEPNYGMNPVVLAAAQALATPSSSTPRAMKKGGRAGEGLMNLKGHEMDFRDGGGFVPIGKKERADDVPARLSKNEFVFTAKAVRNAGGGSAKEGAKKMYQLMKHLEARA
jgi:hypothetical protein